MKFYLYCSILGTLCYLLATVAAPRLAALAHPEPASADAAPATGTAASEKGLPQPGDDPPNSDFVDILHDDQALWEQYQKSLPSRQDKAEGGPEPTRKPGGSKLDSDYNLGGRK